MSPCFYKYDKNYENKGSINYSEYKEKSHVYHQRLNREAEELKSALETIKANKISADKAKRQADLDAKKAAAERKRKEQEQANAEAARKKRARNITIFAIIVAIIVGFVVVSKMYRETCYLLQPLRSMLTYTHDS